MRCLILGLVLLGACRPEGDTGADPVGGVCISGETWTGGDRESPLMHPGVACIECHSSRGEGPSFAAAGTVYTEVDEPDDCNGIDAVTVVITDADGVETALETNAAGNFMARSGVVSFAFPITAKVVMNGLERQMASAVSTGDCNSCHTPEGENGAPGRIYAPEAP